MTRALEQSHGAAIAGTVFDTCEVRWFAQGRLPESVLSWFTAGGGLGVTERRTDVYQRRNGGGVGVKRRDRRILEVKVLLTTGPVVALPGGLRGTCEEWRKWQPRHIAVAADGRSWIDVDKVVVTRSFTLPHEGGAYPVREPDRRVAGCDVEVAAVSFAGVESWSFAFEAFGPVERRLAALRAAAHVVARTTPYPPGFGDLLGDNAGYPAWLDASLAQPATAPT